MKTISKSDMKQIAEKAKNLIHAHAAQVTWKHECNRLHYAMLNNKQASVTHKNKHYTISKCQVADKIFVHLYHGDSANVCVDLFGNLCHTKGGMIIN